MTTELGKGSVLVCEHCGHDFKPPRFVELDTETLDEHKCPQCEKKGVHWLVNLLYNHKSTGRFIVEKGFRLDEEVHQEDSARGETMHDPRLFAGTRVFLRPSGEKRVKAFWLPYWITISEKKYGQFAQIMSEDALVELLVKAIRGGAFRKDSLEPLRESLEDH